MSSSSSTLIITAEIAQTTLDDNILFPIYFGIYFLLTMFSQIAVLLLVIFKTPPAFRDFRVFLINSSLLQISMCLIICFIQVRPVMNINSAAFLFSGPCKLIHKDVCFVSFDIFQLVFDASAFAIPVTLYYKYRKVTSINNNDLSRSKVKLILLSSYLLSIVVGVIYVVTFDPVESLAVESETRDLHSSVYDFTQYAQITGYKNHFWSSLSNNLNILSIYIPPLMSLVFIRLINKKLNSFKHMFTDKTAAQAKKFDLALTIQTLVPAVCVIPVYTFHIAVDGYDPFYFPAHEKILYILLALPTAIDAFIGVFPSFWSGWGDENYFPRLRSLSESASVWKFSEMNQEIIFFDTILFPVYYFIYFSVTMFSQLNVLFLVLLKTPSVFHDFRPFLVNSSLLQILMCSLVAFTQVRPVLNENSIAYLFSGQCKNFSKYVCFFSFDVFQLVFDASSFAIPATLYYKYSKVVHMNHNDTNGYKMKIIFFSTYILSIVVGVIYIFTFNSGESSAVELETRQLFPDVYDYSRYAQITGYQNHVWSSLASNLNTLSIYVPPIISFTLIKLIKVRLNSLKHMFTDKTAAQAKKFDTALLIQTLIPAVSVVPVYSFHLLDDNFPVGIFPSHEKLLYILVSFPTAVDAFIVIFAITPYRNGFYHWYKRFVPCFRKKKNKKSMVVSVVTNSRITSTFNLS